MTPSQSLRQQARSFENLARQTTMGTERIQLSQEAKRLYLAADQAECVESQVRPDPWQASAPDL